jgi:ABC-type glutathione transport system ATPase component
MTDPDRQIELANVSVVFRTGGALSHGHTTALRQVSLALPARKTLGLVGESGSGKSTLAKVLVGLVKPTSGTVTFADGRSSGGRPGFRQLVGQSPRWALNPQLRVWRSVAEPLAIAHTPRAARRTTAEEMLQAVGLPREFGNRHPHQLSGGQLQRAAIARALVSKPGLVVFDEAVSALDVSVQVQTINLIKDLQIKLGFAALFISHDLPAIRYAAEEIAVLYHGMLMHVAPSAAFYDRVYHPYSLALQAAGTNDRTVSLREDPPDPEQSAASDSGCPLAGRCPFAIALCNAQRPELRKIHGQDTACHRAEELAEVDDPTQLVTAAPPPSNEPRRLPHRHRAKSNR